MSSCTLTQLRFIPTVTRGLLLGVDRSEAIRSIVSNHYTGSVPSGKSHYFKFDDAVIVFAIPANMHASRAVTGRVGFVTWELSRLWAPDGHRHDLMTQAISWSLGELLAIEKVDVIVSYADPNVGHYGGVYQAASWVYQGQSEECRGWLSRDGKVVTRRAFHSGKSSMDASVIRGMGFSPVRLKGKHRYAKGMNKAAIRAVSEMAMPYPKPNRQVGS